MLALALGIDLVLGEPPNAWHPVARIGAVVQWLEGRTGIRQRAVNGAPPRPLGELAAGVGVLAATEVASVVPYLLIDRLAGRLPLVLRIVVQAACLKPLFAVRALFDAVQAVEQPLLAEDLLTARKQLGEIVSRPTGELDAALVAAAAIESLTENLSDSAVAPMVAYLAGGLPGAAAYRALNTLDAMLGYRDWREFLGKPAARSDDLVNLAPSRLTAALLCVAAPDVGGTVRLALRATLRDHGATASPNAGWPMAAAAGALGLRLEKAEHYVLHARARLPTAADVGRARRLAAGALVRGGIGLLALAAVQRRWQGFRRTCALDGLLAPVRRGEEPSVMDDDVHWRRSRHVACVAPGGV